MRWLKLRSTAVTPRTGLVVFTTLWGEWVETGIRGNGGARSPMKMGVDAQVLMLGVLSPMKMGVG